MAHSIESRVPFTDMKVFDIARMLPKNYKVSDGTTKVALRNAARKVIPNDAWKKKKLGFPVPIREWIREEDFYEEIKNTFNTDISKELFTMGIDTRVVSMPSMELFLKQNPKYEEQLLPKDIPTFVIEAGSSLIWNRFATKPEYIYGINRFGMSGKSEDVAKILKFDKATILASIANNLTKDVSIDII